MIAKDNQSRYDLELTHAPQVDPTWSEGFILEARMLGIPGTQIGEALAEINSHVVDSGEDPHEAFGDPVEYARALGEQEAEDEGGFVGVVLPVVLQTLGMLATLTSLRPALAGESVPFTLGTVAFLVILAVAYAVLAWRPTPVLRFVVGHPVWAFLAFAVVIAGMVGAQLIPGVLAELPAWWLFGAGVLLLVAGTAVGLVRARSTDDEDPIVSPTGDQAPSTGWASALSRYAPHLVIPVASAILAPILALL